MENQDLKVEKLFNEYRDKVFGFFVDFLSNRDLAEDLTQDIFVKLLNQPDGMGHVQDVDGYIYQMCRNLAYDHLKKAAHNTEYRKFILYAGSTRQNPEISMSTNPIEKKIHSDYYKNLLHTCLESLPEQQRQVFTLSKIEGLSHKRIAEQLGISPHTVRNHLYQAVKNIRAGITHTDLLGLLALLTMGGF